MRVIGPGLFAVAVIATTAAPAAAEDKPKAKQFFDQAQLAEQQERYKDAAELYLEAYDNFAEPEFLFNVGEAYRLAEDPESAVKYYKEYLQLDPNGRGAADAKAAIEKLEPLIETEPEPPPKDPPAIDVRPVEPGPTIAPRPVEPPPEAPVDHGRTLRIAGISTGAVGGVLLAIGIYSGLQARSISNELSDVQQWLPEHDDRFDEGESAETRMFVFGALGVAAAVTGAVLYVAGRERGKTEERAISIAPAVSADRAGILVRGRF